MPLVSNVSLATIAIRANRGTARRTEMSLHSEPITLGAVLSLAWASMQCIAKSLWKVILRRGPNDSHSYHPFPQSVSS